MSILTKIVKLAQELDNKGLTQEADTLDKVAQSWMDDAAMGETSISDMEEIAEPTTTESDVLAILAHEDEETFMDELLDQIEAKKAEGMEYKDALIAAMEDMQKALRAAQEDISKEVHSMPEEYALEKDRLEKMRPPQDMANIFDMS